MFIQQLFSGGGKKYLETVYRKRFVNYHTLLADPLFWGHTDPEF